MRQITVTVSDTTTGRILDTAVYHVQPENDGKDSRQAMAGASDDMKWLGELRGDDVSDD